MGNIHLKYLKEGSCRAYIGISIVDQNEHLAILLVLQKSWFSILQNRRQHRVISTSNTSGSTVTTLRDGL